MPVVGTLLLLGVTMGLAVALGVFTLDVTAGAATDGPVALSASASATDDRLTLVHEGGPPLDVRTLSITVAIDGVALAHQPPVPFFAATGFQAGPTGPFNAAASPRWSVGTRASVRLAGTNTPALEPGVTVTVRITRDGLPLASLETRAR